MMMASSKIVHICCILFLNVAWQSLKLFDIIIKFLQEWTNIYW